MIRGHIVLGLSKNVNLACNIWSTQGIVFIPDKHIPWVTLFETTFWPGLWPNDPGWHSGGYGVFIFSTLCFHMLSLCLPDGDLNGACSVQPMITCTASNTECNLTTGKCHCVTGFSEYKGTCVKGISLEIKLKTL